MSDTLPEVRALFRALGVPNTAGELYILLLNGGAMSVPRLGEVIGLAAPALAQAVSYLKIFRLISQDVDNDEVVLFASNPRNAWKAHDADFYWARTLHVGDIEKLPPLPEMRDEQRRRCYSQLERLCGAIYDQNARAHDPLRHRHRKIHSPELFSSWLATAISSGRKEILAVEMPPRLPELAPIWVALTRQIRAGTSYTRIVGRDEVAEHGLNIVTRDIEKYGIRLRIAPDGFIDEAFYVVDGKRLLLKNLKSPSQERTDFGTYTSHGEIVRRYTKRFHEKYMPASTDARPIIDRLREKADNLHATLQAENRKNEAEIFHDISAFGRFAGLGNADAAAISYLLERQMIIRNAAGHLVMALD